jgi:type VI secretion system Hcp family effector
MTIFTFARVAAAAAGLSLAAAGTANADVFMKVTGAPGDATVRGFEQQIALIGASVSVSSVPTYAQPDDPVPTRTTSVSPIVVSKTPDRSSPKLMLSTVNGEKLGTIEIIFTSTPRAGGPQVIDDRWVLEGAEVQSFQVNPGADRHDAPIETVEIAYKSMRYQHYVTDAKGVRTGAMDEVKWDAPAPDPFADDVGCR